MKAKISLSIISTVLIFASCSTAKKSTDLPQSNSDFKVIDVHTHTRFDNRDERTSKLKVTLDNYLKERKEAGVVATVSHLGSKDEGYQADAKSYNTIHCAGVANTVDTKKIEAGLKSGKYSCIKIYLGYVHQYANDKNYHPAYKLAQKYDVPVVFHNGDTYDIDGKLKYSDPLTIDEVAVDFRKTKFVIAHCGNPWFQSAAEVAYKNPNVFLECSAMLIGDLSRMSEQDLNRYLIEPISWIFGYLEDPSKMMFGTDWPLTSIKGYLDAYKKAIPKEHWQKVFYQNALEVFKGNGKDRGFSQFKNL